MADGTPIVDANSITETIATDELSTLNGVDVSTQSPLIKVQRNKVGFGSDGAYQDVDAVNGLPVSQVGALPTGNNNIGNVDVTTLPAIPAGSNLIGQVDVNNFPASADTTDSISAAIQVNRVMFNLTEIVPAQAFGNVAALSTDSVLVAAVAAKKIYVLALAFVAGGTATSSTFNSKGAGAGTAISPLFANAANGGAVLPFNPAGWFSTNSGEGLTVTTGAGSTTGILVVYAVN